MEGGNKFRIITDIASDEVRKIAKK